MLDDVVLEPHTGDFVCGIYSTYVSGTVCGAYVHMYVTVCVCMWCVVPRPSRCGRGLMPLTLQPAATCLPQHLAGSCPHRLLPTLQTPGVHHMVFVRPQKPGNRVLCRLRRAWKPPSSLWLFPPR